jgi:hypothetical protein
MVTNRDNDVQHHFDGIFPLLDPDTVLLEGALTPEAHREKDHECGDVAYRGTAVPIMVPVMSSPLSAMAMRRLSRAARELDSLRTFDGPSDGS